MLKNCGILYHTNDFQRKLKKTKEYIEKAFEISQKPYVSFSYGKDSTVLSHIISDIKKIDNIFFCSDESLFLYELFDWQVKKIHRNTLSKVENLEHYLENKYKYTEKYSEIMEGYDYDLCFLGLRAEESKARKQSILNVAKKYMIHQYKDGIYRSTPLGFWTSKDIWIYIDYHKLPFLKAYEKLDRTAFSFTNRHDIREHILYTKKYTPEKHKELIKKYPFLKKY